MTAGYLPNLFGCLLRCAVCRADLLKLACIRQWQMVQALKQFWIYFCFFRKYPKIDFLSDSVAGPRLFPQYCYSLSFVHSFSNKSPTKKMKDSLLLTKRKKSRSWRSKSQTPCDYICSWVCICVYHWPGSQEGAVALLIHGHFVLHWVTGELEMYVPGFLRKVPVGCARGSFT